MCVSYNTVNERNSAPVGSWFIRLQPHDLQSLIENIS